MKNLFLIRPFWPATQWPCFRPLLPLTVAFGLGIAGRAAWPAHDLLVLVLAVILFVWAGWLFIADHGSGVIPLLLFAALGYLSLAPWLPPHYPQHHIAHFTDGSRYHIVGTVSQTPRSTPDKRLRLILRVEELGRPPDVRAAAGKLRLTVYGNAPDIRAGDRLAFDSRLRSIRGFRNPGGFDYKRYMAHKQITATAWTRAEQLVIISSAGASAPAMHLLRQHLRRFVETELDGDAQAVMKALTIGDRNAISYALRNVFNRLGIGHLLAISGLHVGIIAIVLMGAIKWICHRFSYFLVTGRGHATAVIATIPFIVAYGLMAGMAPSTQRAVIMVTMGLGAYVVRREGDTLNLVALAGLLILVWHPPMLFAVGFQMSFAAVLAIVLGLRHAWPRGSSATADQRSPKHRLLVFMAVTAYATAGTLPLMMYYFQQFSLIGLAANLIAVPLIGFLALPLGLLSFGLLPISASAASICLQLGGFLLETVIAAGHWAAAFELAALHSFQPTGLEIGLYYALLAACLATPSYPRAKWLLVASLALLVVDAGWWYHYRFVHRDLRLTVLDVGQGSAALLEFPGGKTMLVDAGGYADNRVFDMGRSVIAPFLRRQKILKVDYLVLSHPSSDHMNGFFHVVQHFRPRVLIWNHDRVESESAQRFVALVRGQPLRVPSFEGLQRRLTIGGADVRILNPPSDFVRRREQEGWRGLNNNSIVLQVLFEGCTILMTGDIEKAAELQLRQELGAALKSDVLLVPHHGSRTSSTSAFLEVVAPEFAIISCGWRNRFGFPHPEILARYQEIGSRILRTDIDGAVQMRMRSGQLQIRTDDRIFIQNVSQGRGAGVAVDSARGHTHERAPGGERPQSVLPIRHYSDNLKGMSHHRQHLASSGRRSPESIKPQLMQGGDQ